LREDFLGFVPVSYLTGQGLATTILETLKDDGLDLSKLVRQGYDGAAVMGGRLRGTQTWIRQQYPRAINVHCGAPTLNLAIALACSIPVIENVFWDNISDLQLFLAHPPPVPRFLKTEFDNACKNLEKQLSLPFVKHGRWRGTMSLTALWSCISQF
jgi:hypothetical protein